jgi:hypothetical protein
LHWFGTLTLTLTLTHTPEPTVTTEDEPVQASWPEKRRTKSSQSEERWEESTPVEANVIAGLRLEVKMTTIPILRGGWRMPTKLLLQ